MYTDGITEASDHHQQMYGIERTVECLAQVPSAAPTAGYIERLLGDVDRFVADAAQADDITLLALTWHGAAQADADVCVASQLADVFAGLDRCEHLLQQANVPSALRGDMRLVLEELMVNTVEYGYPDGRVGQIRVLLQPRPDAVTVELIDDGVAFDPLQSVCPNLPGDLADHEQIGGLGIHLARTVTSDLASGAREWKHPRTGQNSSEPLFNGTIFHRVIPNFMIQGGDPEGTGMGGPGYKFADETKGSPHGFQKPGKLAMANAGPNTNGSQFFITVTDTSWLTGKHTIFGEVVEGYEVAEKIVNVPKGRNDRPVKDVVVKSVVIERV